MSSSSQGRGNSSTPQEKQAGIADNATTPEVSTKKPSGKLQFPADWKDMTSQEIHLLFDQDFLRRAIRY